MAYIAADKGPQITRFELSDGALVESCTQRLKHEVSCMEPFAEKSALVLGTRSPSLEIREVVRLEMLREYPLSNWNLLPQLPQQKDPAILQQLKPTQRTPVSDDLWEIVDLEMTAQLSILIPRLSIAMPRVFPNPCASTLTRQAPLSLPAYVAAC